MPIEYDVTTPVSHHFADRRVGQEVAALSDALELRDGDTEPPRDTTERYVYHSEVDIAKSWTEEQKSHLAAVADTYDPELVSLHLASRYQETEVRSGRYVGVGDPYDRETLLANAERNVEIVRKLFGDAPVLIENNNHLGSDAYDVVTDPTFIETIVSRTDTGFLFDIAHAKITAENTDQELERYVSELPLDRCRQVHVSRQAPSGERATDAHDFLRQDDWECLATLQADVPNLTHVTLEYYHDQTVLLDQLERMQHGTSERTLTPERWDSEHFGKQIASLNCSPTTAECLDYALVRCRETGADCLYFETSEQSERAAAVSRGFDAVDTRLVFEQTRDGFRDSKPSDRVRQWRESDVSKLTNIAKTVFETTRFYNDDGFRTELCDSLYAAWIRNACDGYADEVLVAVRDETPVGFITCNLENEWGEIGLVGVATDGQGTGIGTALLDSALHWFRERGAKRVTVETQKTNDAAVGLYRARGFSRVTERYVLHRWFE